MTFELTHGEPRRGYPSSRQVRPEQSGADRAATDIASAHHEYCFEHEGLQIANFVR
ncbi:hypothetical protein GCM10023342_29120 [Modicisalibacter zincidurans]|uniref:Uncharacterized protein n=1 Tax=Modicisalibacter zincidurans TaxID=1178777 RepID=A0ABP9RJG9_9GAMM